MRSTRRYFFAFGLLAFATLQGSAIADDAIDPADLHQLIDQNRKLQEQVTSQQQVIDLLRQQVGALETDTRRDRAELDDLQQRMAGSPSAAPSVQSPVAVPVEQADSSAPPPGEHQGNIHIGGELGAAFFASGSDGMFPKGDFRIDEARLFFDASVWKNVYFYSEVNLVTREAADSSLQPGELYVEIENLSGPLGDERLINLRAGRLYIPFGEEYQYRMVLDDPLISHSASDLWGYDQGIEIYGEKDRFSYVFAVQDGGINSLNTAHKDKSLALRIGYDPNSWMHLSASALRTGHVSASTDSLSALWFGNEFFRAIGPLGQTSNFNANLVEGDAAVKWKGGNLRVAGGLVQFSDNFPGADDTRHMDYFYVETMQHLTEALYGAVRFSGIDAPGGYPIAGQGNDGEYFFGDTLTKNLDRLSFGIGYQFAPPVLFKIEYSAEWGQTTLGAHRNEEDIFSTEIGVRF
jgi:uncharacterized coiled-coil protein SlyX